LLPSQRRSTSFPPDGARTAFPRSKLHSGSQSSSFLVLSGCGSRANRIFDGTHWLGGRPPPEPWSGVRPPAGGIAVGITTDHIRTRQECRKPRESDRPARPNALRLPEQFPFRDVTGKSIQKETLPWTPNFSQRSAANVGGDSRRRRELSAAFRVVHSDKELVEKLGRKDPCPCGSGRRFQKLLHANRPLRWIGS
jgi:SEC-C motif